MAGIYIHVPYCRTRCVYCDFFTQTDLSSRLDYVSALCREIELRKDYIQNEIVRTIYFGGGTPSLLQKADFQMIFAVLNNNFEIAEDVEITLEANPDDLSEEYFEVLRSYPFNRLSIGIQSFDDAELTFLNRRHTAKDAINAVKRAQSHGFDNISIDLIYGLPNQTMDIWLSNLSTALSLNIQHISSYHLIYEEGTKLYRLFEKGKVSEVEEDLSLSMFSTMIDTLANAGFEHYEISNFARKGLYSKHNTSYWQGVKYLGLGPAAHSFDGHNRALNIESIEKYIESIERNAPAIEIEVLDIDSQYNDFILTGMRTKWGVDLLKLEERFGVKYLEYCLANAEKHIHRGDIHRKDNLLLLSRNGIFVSDGIMSDLMSV